MHERTPAPVGSQCIDRGQDHLISLPKDKLHEKNNQFINFTQHQRDLHVSIDADWSCFIKFAQERSGFQTLAAGPHTVGWLHSKSIRR